MALAQPHFPDTLSDIERLWHECEQLVDFCRDPSAVDPSAVIQTICRAARNLAEADGACLILREGELVHYAHEDTVAPLWAGQKFPLTNCISGWSMLHRQRVVIEDIYSDDRIPIEYYRTTFVRSLAMQPIEPRNPIGAIGVYWRHNQRASERQLALLEKLASIAAVVLERTTLRQQLHDAQAEAEAKSNGKDAFLAMASHELRSPLNAILGWVAILRRPAADPAVLPRALEIIERNARAQAQLIEDLVDASRMAAGKLRMEAHSVDIESVVRASIDAAYPAAQSKRIEIDVDIDPTVGTIGGDGARLQQVVRNLLSNAIKFTPDGGRVCIRAERTNSHARITVIDNGIGISRAFLPHVFERFRQADGSHTNRQSGLGLGLAIARHIVEMHGGAIAAHSDGEGRGARFTVTLPIPAPPSDAN